MTSETTEVEVKRPKTIDEIVDDAIDESMARHNGSKPKVAAELGISLKTLYNKLNARTTMKAHDAAASVDSATTPPSPLPEF